MTIPPGCCEMWRGRPAISAQSSPNARQRGERSFVAASGSAAISSATRCAFQPSESRASRSRSAYGRPSALPTSRIAPRERYVAKARDERGVLAAVALDDADDQLLADVAREVEVDVGHRRELAVEEAAEREVVRDRVDVREAGQVADERADGRAAPAAGRQHVPHRAGAAHLVARPRARARAPPSGGGRSRRGRARRSARAPPRAAARTRRLWPLRSRVALGERALADAAQLDDRRLVAVGEVGVAVAELLRQVELRAARRARSVRCDGVAVVGKAVEHLLRRGEHGIRGCRAARARSRRARCGSGRRRARPAARRGARRARARRRSRPCARFSVSARSRSARCGARRRARTGAAARRRSGRGRRRARAALPRSGRARRGPSRAQPERQTSPSFSSSSRRGSSDGGSGSRSSFGRVRACACGEQPAEVRVAPRRLDEERHVRAAVERELRAR